MPTDNDQDILNSLQEIDEDQIMGEEVMFDNDLDFGLEGDSRAVENAPEGSGITEENPPPAVRPPAPAAQPAKLTALEKKRRTKKGDAKATEAKVAADTAGVEVGEVLLRAKIVRIIADRVVIEPKDISISP